MEQEKKYFAGWWFWILILIIGSGILLTGLNYAGIWGKTVVERKVFESSYQYSAGQKDKAAMLESQKAIINSKLMNVNVDELTKQTLQAQLDGINVQLGAMRREK